MRKQMVFRSAAMGVGLCESETRVKVKAGTVGATPSSEMHFPQSAARIFLTRGLSWYPYISTMRFLPFLLLTSLSALAADNWPQYRGPAGDGHTDATGLPVKF